ncbi:MAG: signal peptidase I [Bacteroidota bacterium]
METGAILWIVVLGALWLATTIGQWKLFEKAGEPGWAAIVPIYSWVVWLKIIGKPIWWVVLLVIPVVGTLVSVAMVIELAKAYGKYKLKEHAGFLIFPFYTWPKAGFTEKVSYLGPPDTHERVPKKSSLREWGDALLFAGVAALIIRTFFIEAFMIPTSSMERTLMAGDFLFVSKFHYGARMPMTPMSVPFIHNKIKFSFAGKEILAPSYLDWLTLPYMRLPGLEDIERNDIVVFNFPAHDIQDLGDGAGLVDIVSMKENYIKRCVAVPGDVLEIKRQQIYINGEKGWNPPNMQYEYLMETNGKRFNPKKINELGFRKYVQPTPGQPRDPNVNRNPNFIPVNNPRLSGHNSYIIFSPDSVVQILRNFDNVKKIDTVTAKPGKFNNGRSIYPKKNNLNGELFPFNIDNFGPITIPQEGMSIELTEENLSLYWRVIDVYEGHDLEVKGGKVYIDGTETTTYTFEMNYYWMMGDNRHNSEDSRVWGFVPENHIVGRPLFVFFSYEPDFGVRWNRIGTKYVH